MTPMATPNQLAIPRSEYPRPQMMRSDWINLNGTWTFHFDWGGSGMERGLANSQGFEREILVPFCPESELSGVGHKDFIETMWYHRKVEVPAEWAGRKILLHFGGVDYHCEAFIDGVSVGRHWGGSVSFSFDITRQVKPGESHDLVLYVHDVTRSGVQPGGKQSQRYHSYGPHYTRTTGIWQTVWLEAVSPYGLQSFHLVPYLDGSRFFITPKFFAVQGSGASPAAGNGASGSGRVSDAASRAGLSFRVRLFDNGGVGVGDAASAVGKMTPEELGDEIAQVVAPALDGIPVVIAHEGLKPWAPGNPYLYPLALEVIDAAGHVLDTVYSYAGLRKVHVEGNQVYLNNEPIFQRLVLDQGFYPDGIWTAPSDAALKRDIELAMAAGFNGARLHQKVFEERFHYWADRLGYLTWGESASWGCDVNTIEGARNFLSEWREIVVRDRNHPSIIAWSPFNETSHITDVRQHHRLHLDAYELTKSLDPTRPVNDASGYCHVKTDLWTVHNYTQDPEELRRILTPDPEKGVWRNMPDQEPEYEGQPYIVDEFGGIKWVPPERAPYAPNSWGYGQGPKTLEEFYQRLEGLVRAVVEQPHLVGFCYTQLTDVEQEENGIYCYDRSVKFDMDRIRRIFRLERE